MNIQIGMGILGLLLLQGCGPTAAPPEPVRSVKLITVHPQDVPQTTVWAAEVRARQEARLSFRVSGQLTQRHVGLGQRFKAGQVLAELDPQDQGLAAQAAQAQSAAAQAQWDLARSDFQRHEALFAQGFIGPAEMDRRRTALQAAQAQLEQAKAQTQLQLNQQRYTRLSADLPGVVTGLEAETGQVLAAGTPVLRVAFDGPLEVQVWVSEDQVQAWSKGQAVWVARWNSSERLTARVREVAASADPQTRSYLVRIDLPAQARWALGQTARVGWTEPAQSNPGIVLPTSAVVQVEGQPQVWVFEPEQRQVQRVPVQVLGYRGDQVLVGGGLRVGQQVVAMGGHTLSPGQVVTPYVGKNPSPQPSDLHPGGRP